MNLNNLESTKNQFEQAKVEEQQQEAGGLVILHVESQGRQPIDLRYVLSDCWALSSSLQAARGVGTVLDRGRSSQQSTVGKVCLCKLLSTLCGLS
jgi:hypothetical protein